MSSNLTPFPVGDVIQGALALESSKSTLNRLALLQQSLAFKGVPHPVFPKQSHQVGGGDGLLWRRDMLSNPSFVISQTVSQLQIVQVTLVGIIDIPPRRMRWHHKQAKFHGFLFNPVVFYNSCTAGSNSFPTNSMCSNTSFWDISG